MLRSSNARPIVFDMDGTLFDTKRAVMEAYRAAGIHPSDVQWGKPFHEWYTKADAEDVHRLKTYHYASIINHKGMVGLMPCLWVAMALQAPVITGASEETVKHLTLKFARDLNVKLMSAGLDEKIDHLKSYPHNGLYVDDCEATRKTIIKRTKWLAMSPEDFLQSCSLQVRTLD